MNSLPPKFNILTSIDTKNDGLEDVSPFEYGYFGYPCSFSRVYPFYNFWTRLVAKVKHLEDSGHLKTCVGCDPLQQSPPGWPYMFRLICHCYEKGGHTQDTSPEISLLLMEQIVHQ